MTRYTSAAAGVLLALTLWVLPGLAQPALKASGAWVREPVPGRSTTAAYVVLENPGAAEVHVVGAAADIAGTTELHEMTRSGDMMKMAPVKSITVPARGKVELKPGGLHVMLFDLKRPLKADETVMLTFTTASGQKVQTTAVVRRGQVMR